MEHLELFLKENEGIRKVEGSPYEALLLWAEKEKYIMLKEFAGKKYYFKKHLDQAVMWEAKAGIKIEK